MFADYADMCMQNVTRHLGAHTTRVDVAFDRYIVEDSVKAGKPIRKLVYGQHVPLPLVWSQFIALDANKADLVRCLSNVIMKKGKGQTERYELVT